jgi:hypothetical protein
LILRLLLEILRDEAGGGEIMRLKRCRGAYRLALLFRECSALVAVPISKAETVQLKERLGRYSGLPAATGGPGQSRNQDPCQLDFLYDTNMLDHKRDSQLPDQSEKEGAFHEPILSHPAL